MVVQWRSVVLANQGSPKTKAGSKVVAKPTPPPLHSRLPCALLIAHSADADAGFICISGTAAINGLQTCRSGCLMLRRVSKVQFALLIAPYDRASGR